MMFDRIICPDPAYEQLKESGVMNKILSEPTKSAVRSSLLHNSLGNNLDGVCEKLMSSRFGIERTSMYKELLDCEAEADSLGFIVGVDFKSLLERNPVYLGYLVLGEDLLRHEEFGFGNRKSLERAVTSFCIGERHKFSTLGKDWVWRGGGFKNKISGNEHGDLYVSQMDSSGKDYPDRTLFGDVRVFDSMKRVDTSGFGAQQDWSEFLGSLLKYSEKIGMDGIREIVDWKGELEEIGSGGSGSYAEVFGGLTSAKLGARMLMSNPLMCDGEKLERFPFLVSNGDFYAVPFFRDGKMMYLKKDGSGDIELDGKPFEEDRFLKVVEYGPEDLPDAMRATLKYFARSREMIPAIMNEFARR